MNKTKLLLVFTLVFGLIAFGVGSALAATWVDKTTGQDVSGFGGRDNPYASIHFAVQEVNDNDADPTIFVDDGTYEPKGDLPIEFNNSKAFKIIFIDWQDLDHGDVVIDAESADGNPLFKSASVNSLEIYTILEGGSSLDNKAVIKNVGDYSSSTADDPAINLDNKATTDIYNLQFLDCEIGIQVNKDYDNLQIYKNEFTDESSSGRFYGIDVNNSWAPGSSRKDIYENSFNDLKKGIYVRSDAELGGSNHVDVVDSKFYDNTVGVDLNEEPQSPGLSVNFNKFVGNTDGVLVGGSWSDANFDYNWWGDKSGPYNSNQHPNGSGDSLTGGTPGDANSVISGWTSHYWFSHEPVLPLRGDNVTPDAGTLGASITLNDDSHDGTTYELLKDVTPGDITKYGAVSQLSSSDGTVTIDGDKTYSVLNGAISVRGDNTTIEGSGGGGANPVIVGDSGNNVFEVGAGDLTFDSLTVVTADDNNGIKEKNVSAGDVLTVEGCTFKINAASDTAAGINMNGTDSYLKVTDSKFMAGDSTRGFNKGILINASDGIGDTNQIISNEFTGINTAVDTNNVVKVEIERNNFHDLATNNNSATKAVWISDTDFGVQTQGNTVFDYHIAGNNFDTVPRAIGVSQSNSNDVGNLDIKFNNFVDASSTAGGHSDAYAINNGKGDNDLDATQNWWNKFSYSEREPYLFLPAELLAVQFRIELQFPPPIGRIHIYTHSDPISEVV